MDHLKLALANALGTTPPPTEETPPALPDPLQSEWGRLLRQKAEKIPDKPSIGQLRQISDATVKLLKNSGRGRDAEALQKARSSYDKDREKRAWTLVKERFEALELPERAYRSVKQEDNVDPERVLARLNSKRGELLKGAGADRVRDALLER